jgi:glycerophosphoryl diester phosphodiesterase
MTRITAHRGGAGLWPENSMAAFRNAIGLAGLDAVELDVQACRDGPLVVFHDATLERTSDGHGRLIDRTFAAVRQLRLKDTAAEPPPTLDEVLDMLAPSSVELKLEIKVEPGADASDMVARALEATARHAMTSRTLFMSFDRPAIEALRRLEPKVRFSQLGSWDEDGGVAALTQLLDDAIAAGAAAFGFENSPPEDGTEQVALRKPLIAKARAAGLMAGVWTVNGAAELRAWLAAGVVDDVTTDWPERALAIRGPLRSASDRTA